MTVGSLHRHDKSQFFDKLHYSKVQFSKVQYELGVSLLGHSFLLPSTSKARSKDDFDDKLDVLLLGHSFLLIATSEARSKDDFDEFDDVGASEESHLESVPLESIDGDSPLAPRRRIRREDRRL